MTLGEAGKELGINLDAALERFAGNEGLYLKFLNKMLTFPALENAVREKDLKAVERAAHTLKGVSANLGLDDLSGRCADIVQAVRTDETAAQDDMEVLFGACRQAYEKMVFVLQKMSQGE